jgi:hypothetical protein
MNDKRKIAGVATALVLLVGVIAWIFTAPYPGNQGLSRTPGVRIGGTPTEAPSDFSSLNDVGTNLKVKFAGFPPFVVYLSFVGTPDGVITATRPDNGYWARRVREGNGHGWLRIGDQRFAMQATEVVGDDRIPMLELYSGRTGLPMDRAVGGPDPLRDWEVFFWTPR